MPTVPFEKKKKKWYEVEIIITSEQYTQNRESDPNFPWENPKRTIQFLKKKKKRRKKEGTTARYYASHTKTVLLTRKSVPRSNRQSDHTKTS